MESLDDEIESILFICREVSVYKIPPLKANEGHRANDWGDLASPLWKGRLRMIERSSGVKLQFEDSQTVFANTHYDPKRPSVEAVLDSSRYFVVRVEDGGKKAYIGMGFAERTESFDFNVALQDYTKRYTASLEPPSPAEDKQSPHIPAGPKKDYSLKDGQTFSISIPGRTKPTGGNNLLGSSGSSSTGGGGGVPLLPPPPSAAKPRN
ncbi:adaptin ear-binding coat-associated protein 1 NECAP-1 [Rickenella mellea]|uniref:Adaptin ear-binding coat-associated protein 1 NECAP-1 n=1 Tax=Rickenella mellea TaxID=50990 RepID=A0A4Y7QCH3_9AGAM|nr:adaptin ear-binding coat-associated protein 1 NECAP-1 [Rickenella mellea]